METRLEHARADVCGLAAAIGWCTTVSGFEVDATRPPDEPDHAHLRAAAGAVFAVQGADGRGDRCTSTVDDPDAGWAELRDRVPIVEPPFDTASGTPTFTVADPDGNQPGFVDHVA